jgi:hypothetical protein
MATAALSSTAADAGGGGEGDAAQKRLRALQKKLRQIQQLKERRDKEGVDCAVAHLSGPCMHLHMWMHTVTAALMTI